MKSLRVLYHIARADFLERVRRYNFLILLGIVVWLGYVSATNTLVMISVHPNYVGEINAPWVGALITYIVGFFLGWFGFYLVKGSVARDYETGIGQIIATTPLSRPLYALGKWLSNFALLGLMILILMITGITAVFLVGKPPLDLWALIAPLLFVALPCMAIVAAVAVLFEMIGWLRGGFGNVVYWFMFMMLLIPGLAIETYQPLLDFTGARLIDDNISHAAKLAHPESEGSFRLQILSGVTSTKQFHYDGIAWTTDIILPRLFFILIAFGITMLASVFFDRFNSSKVSLGSIRRAYSVMPQVAKAASLPPIHLTPLAKARHFRFHTLYLAELKMLWKGHRWWWYVVALGLVIAQFSVPHETTSILLAIAWFWMVLLLSGLGNREAIHNTHEIVFSAPRSALIQLPALWLAAVTIVAWIGSGAFLRYLLDGNSGKLLVWLGGVLFIPSLALAMGALTLSRKPFEVVYVTWMYIIFNGNGVSLDFVGVSPASPWPIYILLGVGLFTLTVFIRHWQLRGRSMVK